MESIIIRKAYIRSHDTALLMMFVVESIIIMYVIMHMLCRGSCLLDDVCQAPNPDAILLQNCVLAL